MPEEPLPDSAAESADDDRPYQPTFNANEQAAKAAAAIKTVALGVGALLLVIALFFVGKHLLSNVGKVAWRQAQFGGQGGATLLYADNQQVIGFFAGTLAGINATDGTIIWSEVVGDQANRWAGRPDIRKTAAGFLVTSANGIRCVAPDGSSKWTAGDSEAKVLDAADNTVVISSIATTERELTAAEKAAIEQAMKGLSPDDREKFMLGQRQMGLGMSRQTTIHVLDAATGTEHWQADVPTDRQLVGVATDGDHIFMLTSKWSTDGEQAWLVAIAADKRKLAWQQKLTHAPDWGPVIINGQVGIANVDADAAALFATASGDPAGSAAYDPYAAAVTDKDDGLSPRIEASAEQVAAFVEGNQQWAVSYSGGVIDWAATSGVVASVGHPEGTLSNSEFGMATQALGIDGGALGGMMAQSLGNEATLMQAVKRTHGDVLWKKDDLSGDLVAANQRLVVLQDTARTSRLTVGTGKQGQLIVHQLDPESGDLIGKREHQDFAIGEARIVNDLLIGIAYERGSEEPNCLGLIALHLK